MDYRDEFSEGGRVPLLSFYSPNILNINNGIFFIPYLHIPFNLVLTTSTCCSMFYLLNDVALDVFVVECNVCIYSSFNSMYL